MITLFLAILFATSILVIFRLFPRFEIDSFQAIVFNYYGAAILGFGFFGHEWNDKITSQLNWLPFALVIGITFISLFLVMAKSSQTNGVASTAIAVKMSMAVSLLMMIIGYSEDVTILKTIGIILAFVGVILVSLPNKDQKSNLSNLWLLIVLFFGSGLLDFGLNYVQNFHLENLTPSLFSAISLGFAGILGTVILLYQVFTGKSKIYLRNIIAGGILSIPNYFSIYLLLQSYRTLEWQDSTILAVINVSVVLLSAILGFGLFSERITLKKLFGLITAIIAIATLYIAT